MESPSHSSMDWQGFVAHWADLTSDVRQEFLNEVAKKDVFIPEAVNALTFEDFQKLDAMIRAIDMDVRNGIPSYAAYGLLLQKIKALYIENHPADFDTLSLEEQKEVARNKYDFPTEAEVERFVFARLNKEDGSSLSGSFSFEEKVEQLCSDDRALAKKLKNVYREYSEYFASLHSHAAE